MPQGRLSDQPAQSAVSVQMQYDWNSATEKIFGSALSRPDVYQRATTLVGQTVRVLRARGEGADALLDAWEHPHDLMKQVLADDTHLSCEGLDVSQVVAAACAMRYREVVDELAAIIRREALAASADPNQWVVLAESGAPEGDPFIPYLRLEAHPATGLALAVGTRPDQQFTGCIHSVDVLHIDTNTGQLAEIPPGIPAQPSVECTSQREREQNVARIKENLYAKPD